MTRLRLGLFGNSPRAEKRRGCLLDSGLATLVPVSGATPNLSTLNLDALIINTLDADLVTLTQSALTSGACILCETPAGLDMETMMALRRLEMNSPQAALRFSFPWRYHASVQSALAACETGEFGALRALRASIGLAHPHLQIADSAEALALPMIELLHQFCGPFQDIQSFGRSERLGDNGLSDLTALLRTYDGTLATLHASTSQWRHSFRIELNYESGMIWLDGLNAPMPDLGPEMLILAKRTDNAAPNPPEDITRFEDTDSLAKETTAFLDHISGQSVMQTGTFQDAFDAQNALARCLASDTAIAAE